MSARLARTARAALDHPGWALGFVALGLHLWASGGYGYFRDELYFIVCGEHPDWGYVDQPPLVPLIAAMMHRWFAPSLVMLRLVPALAHGATICVDRRDAARWAAAAGRRRCAGLAVLCGAVYLGTGTILTTDVVAAAVLAVLRLRADPHFARRRSTLVARARRFGGCRAADEIHDRLLAGGTDHWIGGDAASACHGAARSVCRGGDRLLIIVLPNVLWQAMHGWPFLEIGRVGATGKIRRCHHWISCAPKFVS